MVEPRLLMIKGLFMNWKDIGNIVVKSAPLLGGVLGGPAGSVAASLIASLFGANPDNPDDIIAKMQADPNAATKLKQLELEHQTALATLASENYKTEVSDRKSARDYNATLSSRTDWVVHFLAILYTFGFFGFLVTGVYYPGQFDKGVFHDLLNVEMLVLSFYFGGIYKNSTTTK